MGGVRWKDMSGRVGGVGGAGEVGWTIGEVLTKIRTRIPGRR